MPTATDDEIKYWILRVSMCFGRKVSTGQEDEWLKEMRTWSMYPEQWEQLIRAVKLQCLKMPSLGEIFAISREVLKNPQKIEPNWRTWQDTAGRWWAKMLSGFRTVIPSQRDLDQWRREAVQTQEERRKWFEVGWARSGIDKSPAEMFAAVTRKNLATKAERIKRSTELNPIAEPAQGR